MSPVEMPGVDYSTPHHCVESTCRMHAAAPALLEALESIVKLAEAKQEVHSCRLAIATIARAVIAQAKGGDK